MSYKLNVEKKNQAIIVTSSDLLFEFEFFLVKRAYGRIDMTGKSPVISILPYVPFTSSVRLVFAYPDLST